MNTTLSTARSNRSHRRRGVGTALALIAAGAFAATVAVTTVMASPGTGTTTMVDRSTGVAPPPVDQANALSAAFRNAASAIAPSVVSIETVQTATMRPTRGQRTPQAPQMPNDPFGEELFKRFFGQGGGNLQPMPMPERHGQGSGVVVSDDGYIVTNNHVVEGATELKVNLSDGRTYEAKVVGTDPDTDLAVVKIDASGLTPAKLGDSDNALVGDWVVAVGSPFGLDHTVTAGIVSAKQRSNMGLTTFEDFIQTDAAINPGNSGGPLVNLHGEVVGINTAIRSQAGGSDGIGFAIPSSTVKTVVAGLKDSGRVDRGWLGVQVQPLTPDLAQSFGYSGAHGVLLAEALSGEPAAIAGLQAGDILTKVNGRPIESPRDLVMAVGMKAPGEKVEVELMRDGAAKTVTVVLGQRTPELAAARGMAPAPSASSQKLGIAVESMSDEQRAEVGINGAEGVVIAGIEPGSPAAMAGLQQGDVILSVDRHKIETPAEFNQALAGALAGAGDAVRLRVLTQGGVRYLVIKPGQE
ncbi:MAG: DegQ family serine endoprotease [Phycisphaerales bacterium]|nr:DegQ family serine endoprotease [Phycisphaerales bacterium]